MQQTGIPPNRIVWAWWIRKSIQLDLNYVELFSVEHIIPELCRDLWNKQAEEQTNVIFMSVKSLAQFKIKSFSQEMVFSDCDYLPLMRIHSEFYIYIFFCFLILIYYSCRNISIITIGMHILHPGFLEVYQAPLYNCQQTSTVHWDPPWHNGNSTQALQAVERLMSHFLGLKRHISLYSLNGILIKEQNSFIRIS